MSPTGPAIVTGKDGLRGTLEPSRSIEGRDTHVQVRLDSGESILVPLDTLILQQDGTYYLPLSRIELERLQTVGAYQDEQTLVVPVIAEELDVHKRVVEGGGVRLHKTVHERQETIDESLVRDEVHVQRVPINRVIDQPLSIRQEGDTMIVPVLEERLIVEKQLVLKEEIHITRQRVETREPQHVTLRSEEVTVEQLPG